MTKKIINSGDWTLNMQEINDAHVLSLDDDNGHHELIFDVVYFDGNNIRLQRHGAETGILDREALPTEIVSGLKEVQ